MFSDVLHVSSVAALTVEPAGKTSSTASDVFLVLGVAVLSIALRSFRSIVLQKLGAFGVLATSFLIGWRFTGYWGVGVICASSWLMLPWLEILTRVRRLTLPTEKKLRHKHPPNEESFPALDGLTGEIEGESFARIEDTGWDWQDYAQFFRLFYKETERTQAASVSSTSTTSRSIT